MVAAQYGPIVIMASTDGEGYGSAPDQLQGIRVADGQRIWTFRCDDDGDHVSSASPVPTPATIPTAGRVTEFAEQPLGGRVCSNATVSLNPQTGKKLKR